MTGTGRLSPSRSAPRRRSRHQERCRAAPGRPPAGTAAPPRGRYSTPRKGRCPPRWRNRSPPPTSFRQGSAGRSPARSGADCSRRRRPARPRPPPRGWSRARSRSDRARCSRTPVVHRRPTRRPRARQIQRRPQERKSGPVSSSSLPKRAATPPTRDSDYASERDRQVTPRRERDNSLSAGGRQQLGSHRARVGHRASPQRNSPWPTSATTTVGGFTTASGSPPT